MSTFASLFGFRRSDRHYISVLWNDRKHNISLKEFPEGLSRATVRDLKEICKRLTGVPLSTMVLMYLGAYLKDDTAPLTSCGIREGAEVTVFGERPDKEKVKQTASKDSEEYGYLTRIGKITKTLQERVSQVDAFEALANEGKNAQLDEKTVHDEGVFLSESLMQALIALDGISCPPEFETARAQRRAAVKLSQQLLDRVDNSRTILKDLFKSKM